MTTVSQSLRILLLERESNSTGRLLERAPDPSFDVVPAASLEVAVAALRRKPCDVVLVDLAALDSPDPSQLDDIVAAAPAAAVVVLWEGGTQAAAREWARAGAQDCVPRPCLSMQCGFGGELLRRAVIHAHERRRNEQRLADLALHDDLTGLPNRRALDGLLIGALARGRRHGRHVAVLFVDLDRFKAINDRFGHAAGDQVLRQTATRLRACLRTSDVVGRLGGDEFLVIVEDVEDARGGEVVAAKVRRVLQQPFVLGANRVRCTASVGVVVSPPSRAVADPEALVAAADAAMYRVKAALRRGGRRGLRGSDLAAGPAPAPTPGRAALPATKITSLWRAPCRRALLCRFVPASPWR